MRILYIEDDVCCAFCVTATLKDEGMEVATAPLGEDGLHMAQEHPFDVILLDLSLPDISGIEVLRTLRRVCIATPIIIVSGYADATIKAQTLSDGACAYIEKPFSTECLLGHIKNAHQ